MVKFIVEDICFIVILETDLAEFNFSPHLFKGLGIRRISDLRLVAHQLKEALKAAHTGLQLLGKGCKASDGLEEKADEKQVGGQIGVVDLSLMDNAPPTRTATLRVQVRKSSPEE